MGATLCLWMDAPYFILGAQVNNSSGWPGRAPEGVAGHGVSCTPTPSRSRSTGNSSSPRQGQFDYSVVDTLLTQARAHRMRLVLLWFATWKNGNPHYMPEWMKLAPGTLSARGG